MKKKLLLILCIILSFSVLAYAQTKKGVGTGVGKHGDILVEVTFDKGKIKTIDILENKENKVLAKKVFTELKDTVVKSNSVNVDGISGATYSTKGFLDAVQAAADNAGVKLSTAAVASSKKETLPKTQNFDVVVIGSGGAGFSAAVMAKSQGVNVVIVEKMPNVGGNSLISGAEMNVADSWVQHKVGIIDDTAYLHYEDTMKGGDFKGDPAVVRVMTDNALEAAEWLRDEIKVSFLPDNVFQFGGHSRKRALIPEGHTGTETITKFQAAAERMNIPVILDMKAVELVKNKDGRVVSVKAERDGATYTFNASKGVVLATGGFGANIEMRNKYNNFYNEKFLTTNMPGATGDGMLMAEKAGAQLVNMDYIQTYPVCDPVTGVIALVADSRFDGAILVNQNGKRFVEELERRDVISKAILDQQGSYAYQLWSQNIESISNPVAVHQDEYEAFMKQGIMFKGETLQDVAKFANIDYKALKATVDKVNQYAKQGKDGEFNHRGGLKDMSKGPYYIMKAVPSVHHTMGGVRINTKAQALTASGRPIPGLYAAGEITGVTHGTNRLGGNAYTDIIVFGRIAGFEVSK